MIVTTVDGQEVPAIPQSLAVLGDVFTKFLPQQGDWQTSFQKAVSSAQERGANLEPVVAAFFLWLLDGHKYSALSCAFASTADHVNAVRWAVAMHDDGVCRFNDAQIAKLASHARGFGAAGVHLMSFGSAAVATAYASLVARRVPSFSEWTVLYASTAMTSRLFGSGLADNFWQIASTRLLELIDAA